MSEETKTDYCGQHGFGYDSGCAKCRELLHGEPAMTESNQRVVNDCDCATCGTEKEPVSCWQCGGEGGWHDCFDDTCCCLDKESITNSCDICKGAGSYLVCPSCYPDSFDDY